MTTSTHLIHSRRFLPLFVTQLLNAFNDNLFKNAVVLFVVYSLYNSEAEEAKFTAIASGLFILPFFILSALSGQLADMRDKAKIIRIIKACEIGIMVIGALGLLMAWQGIAVTQFAIPLMLAGVFLMGVHSTFFGPIKYAILPQHLHPDEVLAGTGLVEAGTYMAVLGGTILAGWIPVQWAALGVILTAIVGYFTARQVPDAPPAEKGMPLDLHLTNHWFSAQRHPLLSALVWLPMVIIDQIISSYRLVNKTAHESRIFLAIMAISFFWTIGAVLFIQFPPLAKNVLNASKEVASLFLVIFSVGIAIGSVSVNALLKGRVSARYSPGSVMVMGLFIVALHLVCKAWTTDRTHGLMDVRMFVAQPLAPYLLASLLGIAVAGGMFVVPLYAFLTTISDKSETARTIAANNIVNSGAMVIGTLLAILLSWLRVAIGDQLLLSAGMCVVSAWLGWMLYRAECKAVAEGRHQVEVRQATD